MNKILLDKESIINLVIVEDSICEINRNDINEINIEIKDNIKFRIIHKCKNSTTNNLKINIKQNNNSEFIYNHNFINNNIYNLDINIELKGNNSKNKIYINGISDMGKSNITLNGKVNDNTKDNELLEKVNLLNINEGKSVVLPNMFINTKNVIADHAVSITNINEDYLFYLNSKGIDNDNAKKLIIDGFLNK
ncbi:MAG: SufD family Fe-S cluster assembly protein [Bacilli bacterium]|nr:SufD family Fe-S cluster assembly protein [Bacilli bacterium]